MKFVAEHTYWAIELWTIVAIVALVLLLVFIIVKHNKVKKKAKEMEQMLEDLNGDESSTPSDQA